MSSTPEEVKVQITGSSAGATQAMSEAAEGVTSGVSKIKDSLQDLNDSSRESFDGVGESLEQIRSLFEQAFEFTGLAAAYEGITKIGEEIEKLGDRAIQMRTMSEVLGITTDEFQALSLAAEESGVSIETTARAIERLEILLNKARQGSGDAVEKLHALGITNEQIASSTFNINDMLEILRQRLEDSGTHQQTMNALMAEFGPRAALAAEALKTYHGSAEDVAKAMDRLNGLSGGQIDALKEEASWWKQVGTQIANTASKAALFLSSGAGSIQAFQGPGKSQSGGAADGAANSANAAAQGVAKSLQDVGAAVQQVTLQEVQDARLAIETYKQGSDERLAAVQRYSALANEYYGKDVDKARAASAMVLAEERANADERKRTLDELSAFASEYYIRTSNESARAHEKERQLNEKEASDYERQMEHLVQSSSELYVKVTNEAVRAHEKLRELNERMTRSWGEMADKISQAWSNAMTGLIMRTTTWEQIKRSLETRALQSTLQLVTQSVTRHVAGEAAKAEASKTSAAVQSAAAQEAAQESVAHSAWAALKKIANDAESAASGAFQAVVGIPYVGPILAPIAAATAFAAVIAFEGGIASAAGGFDIPSGVNPITQLHSEEMVLPAGIANPLRAALAGAGAGGGGDTNHFHISALDAKSFHELVHRPSSQASMSSALKQHYGRGGK